MPPPVASRTAYYRESYGADERAFRQGIVWLANATLHSPSCVGRLAVSAKKMLFQGIFEDLLSKPLAKAMTEDRTVQINGASVALVTESQRLHTFDGPILAIYPGKKLLDIYWTPCAASLRFSSSHGRAVARSNGGSIHGRLEYPGRPLTSHPQSAPTTFWPLH